MKETQTSVVQAVLCLYSTDQFETYLRFKIIHTEAVIKNTRNSSTAYRPDQNQPNGLTLCDDAAWKSALFNYLENRNTCGKQELGIQNVSFFYYNFSSLPQIHLHSTYFPEICRINEEHLCLW
jgi:hypothetical protein